MSHHCHHTKHSSQTVLIMAAFICIVFATIEALVGHWSGSLALMTDAAHMASDCFALSLSAASAWLAGRQAGKNHTYGYERAEIIGASISSIIIIIMAIFLTIEAFDRIKNPEAVSGVPVIIVASIGLVINGLIAWVLTQGRDTLNKRAAMLHVMGDLLGSIAALISGAVITMTQWTLIDPLLSLLICTIIVVSSLRLLKESLRILMESSPPELNIEDIKQSLLSLADLDGIHDLHVWTLSTNNVLLSAHVEVNNMLNWPVLLTNIRHCLANEYGIQHITLQAEPTRAKTRCPQKIDHHPKV